MKITVLVEDPDNNEQRLIVKDFNEAWDFDLFAAADFIRDMLQVAGFSYVDNVTIHSKDKEWFCKF